MKKYFFTSAFFFSTLILLTPSSKALAETRNNFFKDVESAPWEAIHHANPKTHIIDACAARVNVLPYRLVLGGSKNGLEMWIANDEWHLSKSFKDSVAIKMKDFTFKGTGYYYAQNRIFLRLSQNEMQQILNKIENGGTAKVNIKGDANFKIPLTHGRHVLKSFRKCVTSMAFADLRKEKHR